MVSEKQLPCIWITRPKGQAENLIEEVNQSDLKAIHFPVIKIQAVESTSELQDRFNKIDIYDYLIFISRNAVECSFNDFINLDNISSKTKLIAIGNATAHAIQNYNLTPIEYEGESFDSETLLTLPTLQKQNVFGKRVLLIRGKGGRDLLYNELNQRGALVDLAEVYSRENPDFDNQYLINLWQDNKPDAIIVTSNESIDNLISLTPLEHKATLYQVPLIVMSERNLVHARTCGFSSDIQVAPKTSDNGLMQALIRLLEKSQT